MSDGMVWLSRAGMDRDVELLDRLAARAKRERYRAEAIASSGRSPDGRLQDSIGILRRCLPCHCRAEAQQRLDQLFAHLLHRLGR